MPTWIRTIPRSESLELPVLVRISSSGDDGLDLKLQATEGENKFKGRDPLTMVVKEKHIDELCSESYNGSNDEWRAILMHSLRLGQSSKTLDDQLKALDVVASLSGDAPKLKLTVTIRRKVSGISQKLGAIVLKQDEKIDLNAIDWACEAVGEVDDLRSEIPILEKNYQQAQETIKSLDERLDELLASKKAHEAALVSKFAELLNEKKVKIRNQQRLLSTAKIDPKKLKDMRKTAEDARNRSITDRKGKRKVPEPPSESETSDDFETMRPKTSAPLKGREQIRSIESDRETTQTETETESDIGNEEDTRRRGGQDSTPSSASDEDRTDLQITRSPSPPPPRELPFNRKGSGEGNAKEADNPPEAIEYDSDETASASDDEL